MSETPRPIAQRAALFDGAEVQLRFEDREWARILGVVMVLVVAPLLGVSGVVAGLALGELAFLAGGLGGTVVVAGVGLPLILLEDHIELDVR